MRALLQRVKNASVTVDDKTVGKIGQGILIFLGVMKGDGEREVSVLVNKIEGLRIFEDENGKMNLSVREIGGSVLVVSQFTLAADCKKGRRPGFELAASPIEAAKLCDHFVDELKKTGLAVETGRFAAHMEVVLLNDGPVTIWLDTAEL